MVAIGEINPFCPLLSSGHHSGNIRNQWGQECGSSMEDRRHPIRNPRENYHRVPVNTATHMPQLVIYLRRDLWLP